MNKYISTIAATLALAVAAGADTSPVKVLNATQVAALQGASYTPVAAAGADFRTGAAVVADGAALSRKIDAERQMNATASVWAGTSAKPMPAMQPADFGAPATAWDFKQSGDAAQGWATMTQAGMPFLQTQTHGKGEVMASASWSAKIVSPGNGQVVYVQFRLPSVQVSGTTEEDGPATWQSRVRAELHLNGHPVWNTEASRVNLLSGPTDGGSNCTARFEKKNYLATFGAPLPGLTSTKTSLSNPQVVTLALGSFPSGQTLDLRMIVSTQTQNSDKCCLKNNEYFCTTAVSSVAWDNTAVPVKFWVGPAL